MTRAETIDGSRVALSRHNDDCTIYGQPFYYPKYYESARWGQGVAPLLPRRRARLSAILRDFVLPLLFPEILAFFAAIIFVGLSPPFGGVVRKRA
jgi:hypothetical protein